MNAQHPLSQVIRCAFIVVCVLVMGAVCPTAHARAEQVDATLCQALVQHHPNADVEYQEGVDLHGNPVLPADIDAGSKIKLPRVIKIPLTVNLAKTLNLDTTQYPWNKLGQGTEAQLGMLTVEGKKVKLNGQNLSDMQQENLSVLCIKAE